MNKKPENENIALETAENEFATGKITPLFWKYSLLALIGLIAQAISVIADGFFVGNSQGTLGLATISIVSSIWTVILALGGLFAIGGSTLISNKLGEGDPEGAREAYASVTIFTFLLSIVLTVLCVLFMDQILIFLGATEEILPYAKDYVLPYFLAIPVTIPGTAVYYFARAAGKPIAGAVSYIAPAIVATILEYIFLLKMDMGMEGSAYSWVICVGAAALLVPYLQFAKNGLKIHLSDFKMNFTHVGNSVKIGFAPFLIQLCVMLNTVVVNRQIVNYGHGELEIAAFGTINAYVLYIFTLLVNALISGLLPIASFNYGKKDFPRVKEVLKKSTIQSVLSLTALLTAIFIFAKPIVAFFVGADVALIDPTISIMLRFLPLSSLGALALIVSGYFQAIESIPRAMVSALCRVAFSVPLLFLLPALFGYQGIWYAQPLADGLAFVLCLGMVFKECRNLDRLQN